MLKQPIILEYETIDGVYKIEQFTDDEAGRQGAAAFVNYWLGDDEGGLLAEISEAHNYAVTWDGVGKVMATKIELTFLADLIKEAKGSF